MQWYEMHGPGELAYETTVGGHKTGGLLGPVFLLAPLSLLALRFAPGRRLLLGALVFLLPYPFNLGTRFLLPAVTLLAPAMAMGLGAGAGPAFVATLRGFISWPSQHTWFSRPEAWRIRPLAVRLGLGFGSVPAALVVLHAILSWPSHIGWYSHRYAWRIDEIPIRAALRLEPEDEFLSRKIGDTYRMVRFIEQVTPPGSRIFAFDAPPIAYCEREILPVYFSALNQRLCDGLWAGYLGSAQPVRLVTFRMSPQPLLGLRLAETGSDRPITPAISELRIFGPAGELPPARRWRLDAHPFPWDAGLAFDGNPTTRWDAWQETRTGAWIEAGFGNQETITAVRLETTPDQASVRWELLGETAPRKWSALSSTREQLILPSPLDLRRAAIEEFKRNNIRYLLVNMSFAETEFRAHAVQWGVRLVGKFGGDRLYALD